jgi:nucleolar MIF4G domain-containing protein 1
MGEDGFEMDEETRKEMAMLQAEDAEFLRGMDELPTDESDLDSDVDLAEFESTDDEAEDDEEIAANTRRNQQAATSEEEEEEVEEEEEDASAKSDQEAEDSENDDEDIDEAAPVVEEDIYGRPVVKVSPAAAPSAYLPPHLRRKLQAEAEKAAAEASSGDKKALLTPKMDEQALRELTRRINGQLNRISESNMEPIALEMEALYRQNVRSAVNQILHDKMLQTACHPRQVMTSLIKVCSALVAALYHSVGTELGGFFVEKIVRQLNDAIEAGKSQEASVAAAAGNDDEASETSKEPVNLVLFVAMLYNFGVVHCTLVYDLFRSLVASFSSIEIELIHHLLKASGAQLRADDADALREMIALVQQKVVEVQASGPDSQQGDRIRFILDLIYDLKKPASKQKKAAGSAALDLTSLKKWLGRVKTRCGNANNPLRVSLHELLHADEDGRWWVVGGTWVGYQASKAADTNADELDDEKDGKAQQRSEEARLLRLAEKQRMNTDVRKRIFVAIMGAADCLDAYERLLQLNLREKQEREIVRVLLHCCGQEKKFNQYYLVLADKLCEMDPRYKFTFQLAYWDVFKQIETLAPRRLYNQALMLAGLVTSASLSLSCLKVLDFTQLEDKAVLFLRVVLEKVLKLESELEMARVFQRLLQTKKAQLTIDGLAVFMHQHMTSFRGEQDPAARTLLKKRAKSARNLLDQLAKSAALTEHRESFK